jgi:glycerol-3-phosphate acyltransferase PlsX
MAIRVAVDAMGGDHAPAAIVRGAVAALADDPELQLVLVGDEGTVRREVDAAKPGDNAPRIRIVHASQVVGMDEAPVEALKTKKDSSLVKMAALAAEGQADAVISAGNTGAFAAAAQFLMKPLPCVSRPGIAVTIPSFYGPFVLCDVGANIQAKARHLYEYAIMASIYAEKVLNIKNPRVALVSIGEESGKGTGLVKQTTEMLKNNSSVNFVGNAEGRDLFEDHCDVAICDGFVGNIVLKFVEGLAEGLFKTIAREFHDETPELKVKFTSRSWTAFGLGTIIAVTAARPY